jgi:4-hydroxy-tetrahydrodipicolinate synthase
LDVRTPQGIIPAMVTVFNKDGSVDEQATRNHAEWLIQHGVHGLAPAGSTGEAVAMTPEERTRVVKAVISQVKGRVPVFPGTGHYDTALTLRQSREAIDAGADTVMIILPYYYMPTIDSTMIHLARVAKEIGRPFILYNNPWFAGFELMPEQVKKLLDDGVICGIKAAHGDPMRVNYLKYLCGDKLKVLYGHDYSPLEAFAVGADGWLSGMPNVYPKHAAALYEAVALKKDLAAGQEIWAKMLPLSYYFMYQRKGAPQSPHWLPVIKAAITKMGGNGGYPRLPALPLGDEDGKILAEVLKPLMD